MLKNKKLKLYALPTKCASTQDKKLQLACMVLKGPTYLDLYSKTANLLTNNQTLQIDELCLMKPRANAHCLPSNKVNNTLK